MKLRRRSSPSVRSIHNLQRYKNRLIWFTISFGTRHLRSTFNKVTHQTINLQRRFVSRAIRLYNNNGQLLISVHRSNTNSLAQRALFAMFLRCTSRFHHVVNNGGPFNHRQLTSIRTRVRQHVVQVKRTAVNFISLRTKWSRVRRCNIRAFCTSIHRRLVGLVRNNVR